MVAGDTPVAEVDIDRALVRGLLADQHPDLAGHELTELASGWDNVLYRLGTDLVVRLPRRELAADLVRNELRWLPELAPRLPLPIPVPLRAGLPGRGYPWSWLVSPYLPGRMAAVEPPRDLGRTALELGRFLAALHVPAPADAPTNPARGIPLAQRDERFRASVAQLATDPDVDVSLVTARWEEALRIDPWTGPGLWLHGDLHPANLLVDDGRLSAVIDFGDVTGGDPATDLGVAWMLFPPLERSVFRDAVGGVDDSTWARARGWALAMAVALLAATADDPVLDALGRRTLAAVLADD